MKMISPADMRRKDNPLYYDIQYRVARTAVFKRDRYKCRICKRHKNSGLTVHHIEPKHKRPDLACVEENMISLCYRCHRKVEEGNYQGNKWQKLIVIREKGR